METQDEGGDRRVSVGLISAYSRKAWAGWSYQGKIRKCFVKSPDLKRVGHRNENPEIASRII